VEPRWSPKGTHQGPLTRRVNVDKSGALDIGGTSTEVGWQTADAAAMRENPDDDRRARVDGAVRRAVAHHTGRGQEYREGRREPRVHGRRRRTNARSRERAQTALARPGVSAIRWKSTPPLGAPSAVTTSTWSGQSRWCRDRAEMRFFGSLQERVVAAERPRQERLLWRSKGRRWRAVSAALELLFCADRIEPRSDPSPLLHEQAHQRGARERRAPAPYGPEIAGPVADLVKLRRCPEPPRSTERTSKPAPTPISCRAWGLSRRAR